jgi:large subunit ribosomal protein LP2
VPSGGAAGAAAPAAGGGAPAAAAEAKEEKEEEKVCVFMFSTLPLSDLHFPPVQEESDEDMGFGLFD